MFLGIGYYAYQLCVLGLLVFACLWLIRKDREKLCPVLLIVPFMLLAVLAFDGGLCIMLSMIDATMSLLTGKHLPATKAWTTWYEGIPFVLAVILSILALGALIKIRFRLRFTIVTTILAVVAVMQGLLRLTWFSPYQILYKYTNYSGTPPWSYIVAAMPRILVFLAAVILLLGYFLNRTRSSEKPSSMVEQKF